MSQRSITFLGKHSYHPLVQAGAILAIGGVGALMGTLGEQGANTEWYIASTMLLFFACGNPIMGIFRKNWKRYVLLSIPAFLVLGLSLVFFTDLIAFNGIRALSEFQQYFLAVTVFYFLTLFLVGIFRFIVQLINTIE